MSITIAQIKSRVARKLHGASINKVAGDFYDLCLEASINLQNKLLLPSQMKTTAIPNGVFGDVFEYALPTDISMDRIVGINFSDNSKFDENFRHRFIKEFNKNKENKTLAISYNGGMKTLRLAYSVGESLGLNSMDGLTDDGTWSTGGDATGLTADELNYVEGSGSLRFSLSGAATTATLTNTTSTAVDLTDYEDIGSIFMSVYLPDESMLTSLNLRWGDDSSNYWTASATTQQDGNAFKAGWNLVRFDWSGATETGTPTVTAVNYYLLTLTYDGDVHTNLRADNLVIRNAEIMDMSYYSQNLFRNSSGTWLIKPTADTDLLNGGEEVVNMFVYELAYILSHEIYGEDSSFDFQFLSVEKENQTRMYGKQNPAQNIKKTGKYYRFRI